MYGHNRFVWLPSPECNLSYVNNLGVRLALWFVIDVVHTILDVCGNPLEFRGREKGPLAKAGKQVDFCSIQMPIKQRKTANNRMNSIRCASLCSVLAEIERYFMDRKPINRL